MDEEKIIKPRRQVPLGIIILGSLNCLLGLSTLVNYFRITPQNFENLTGLLAAKNLSPEITFQQFKASGGILVFVGSLFLASGAGVIGRKEWARKITLYFSFLVLAMIFLVALAQPALTGFFIIYLGYFAILIFYFTNKNIENVFTAPLGRKQEENKEP